MKKYLIIVEQTETGFSAFSPDVPGCGSTGKTKEEVERNIQEAIEFHLEGLREEGYEVPEPSSYHSWFEIVEDKPQASIKARWKAGKARWSVWKVEGILLSYKLETSVNSNSFLTTEDSGLERNADEIQLRKYTSHYERYNFYMEIALKVIVFSYIVTGSILSFYLSSDGKKPYLKLSLVIPIILGIVWGVVFLYGAYLWLKARKGVLDLEQELIQKRLIVPPPDFHLLLWLLIIFGGMFFLIAAGMILLSTVKLSSGSG